MNYRLPYRFDDDHLDFIRRLDQLVDVPDVTLDFSRVGFVLPFATLTIAMALMDLTTKRDALGMPGMKADGLDRADGVSYLKYFGFFQTLRFDVGNAPNEAPGSSRYLPITVVRKEELEAASGDEPFQVEIDRQSDRLAKVIFPDKTNAAAASMLSFCLREIIRNTFEHGKVRRCAVMAQRWNDGDAEIAIADRGIGIHTALTAEHKSASEEASIRKAILPGITSGSSRSTGSKWDNTGFGLYIASELGQRYGSFAVLSSGGYLRQDDVESYEEMPQFGTIVKLRVNTDEASVFPYILKEIVEEGEKRAETIPGAIKSASKTSKSIII